MVYWCEKVSKYMGRWTDRRYMTNKLLQNALKPFQSINQSTSDAICTWLENVVWRRTWVNTTVYLCPVTFPTQKPELHNKFDLALIPDWCLTYAIYDCSFLKLSLTNSFVLLLVEYRLGALQGYNEYTLWPSVNVVYYLTNRGVFVNKYMYLGCIGYRVFFL